MKDEEKIASFTSNHFEPSLNPPPSRGRKCIAYPPYSKKRGWR